MGAYLSEPVKEKVSEDGGDPRFSYGASSMQGWRISQEDAHNCIISLGDEAKLSLFAVYDGHGGAEVAQYTAQHFPQHIFKQKQSSSKTNFSDTLEESFLSFDQHLKQPTVLQNLREIAGGGGKPANKDADPKEARMLQKEASMPLEQILAKYVHHRASAMLKERRRADGEEVSDDEEDEGDDEEEDEEDDDDEEGEEDEDDDDDDDDAQDEDEEENDDEGGEKVVNGEKEDDDAEQEKTPKENGVMVNGDHASSEEAEAEAEAEEEKSSSSAKKESKFEMEEFGIKGASKCGKGGKGKGKKTLLPRVPIEASPAIQAKTDSKAPKTESKLAKVDPAPIPLKMDLEQQLLNGHSENENNENKEREQQTRTNGDNNTPPREEENDRAAVSTPPEGTASSLKTEGDDDVDDEQQQQQQQLKSESAKESDSKEKTTTTATAKEAATNGDVEKKSTVVENGSSADAEAAEAEGEKKVGEEEGANAEGSSAGSSSAGATSAGSKRSRKAAPVRHVKLLEMNTDDDSDDSEDDLETKMMKDLQEPESDDSEGDDDGEDVDDGGEDDDEEDGEDDEDEEADGDDDDDDEDYEDIQGGGEEPGFDSGCTACVSLLVGNELFVANVGDSRCVVSRAGEAVDMSFDHKPTDEVETDRITKAGGKVTEDGRVNGGLNLSRALGDHSYKKVTNLSDREQMISALPDIKSMVLTNQDEFMVIACDGIWNSLTSQEVIDFVKMRIDHEKELTLSQICEELFDHCLAPHTMGDGTGCDNMTCIIVRFDSVPSMSGSGKRSKADDGEEAEEAAEAPSGKRQRLDGDEKDAA